ncbi:MAG: exosome complex RNA-binding protein Csl4 [Candidatus Bathyarchaeia archaeon]
MENRKTPIQNKFIVPGEKLGVIEEFIPGAGTYEDNGTIFSTTVGRAEIDPVEKTVKVKSCSKTPLIPKEGDIVSGFVVNVQDKLAIIDIYAIGDKTLHLPFTAALHIANSSPRYERLMGDICKRGDFIKAKVINVKNRMPQLTTVGREFGVIRAFCSKCGEELTLAGRILICPACGNKEIRKISEEYDGKKVSGRRWSGWR